jgi:hypothetical protein
LCAAWNVIASMFPPPGSCTVFQSMPTTSGSGKGQLKPLDGGEKMTVTGPADHHADAL